MSQLFEKIKSEKDIFKKARAIEDLIKNHDCKVKDIATYCTVSSSYICHVLRLLRLPEIVIDGYYSSNLSLSHLFIISRLKDEKMIIQAYERVLTHNLNISSLEDYVREKLYAVKGSGVRVDENIKKSLVEKYKKIDKNLQIEIIQTRIQAKIVLLYRGSLKETSKILEKLADTI